MSEKDHECWICKKANEKGEVIVKDHNYITRKYRGSNNQECNLNLGLTKKIPSVFHNLQKYD